MKRPSRGRKSSMDGFEAPIQWRVAQSLETLRFQLNAMAPGRSKASDGGIGDTDHQNRNSDHNPWVLDGSRGVVTARDFTHDPAGGCDCEHPRREDSRRPGFARQVHHLEQADRQLAAQGRTAGLGVAALQREERPHAPHPHLREARKAQLRLDDAVEHLSRRADQRHQS